MALHIFPRSYHSVSRFVPTHGQIHFFRMCPSHLLTITVYLHYGYEIPAYSSRARDLLITKSSWPDPQPFSFSIKEVLPPLYITIRSLMFNPRYFKMFKKSSKKKGAIRKRKLSEDEEQKDDEVDQNEMEKLKLAKLKRELLTKKAGVSAVALAKGKKISKKAELTDDPFKLKSGKSRNIRQILEYLDLALGIIRSLCSLRISSFTFCCYHLVVISFI